MYASSLLSNWICCFAYYMQTITLFLAPPSSRYTQFAGRFFFPAGPPSAPGRRINFYIFFCFVDLLPPSFFFFCLLSCTHTHTTHSFTRVLFDTGWGYDLVHFSIKMGKRWWFPFLFLLFCCFVIFIFICVFSLLLLFFYSFCLSFHPFKFKLFASTTRRCAFTSHFIWDYPAFF